MGCRLRLYWGCDEAYRDLLATCVSSPVGICKVMIGVEGSTRERIIDAAGTLFYREGVRAVSVDAIAETAGVTKRTLYYHFRSKDDLIAAYLEGRDQPNLATFQRWYDKAEGDVADRVKSIFLNLARSARHPKWKGCGFLRTAAELVNFPGHPAIVTGRAHKKGVEDWFCTIFDGLQPSQGSRQLARQVVLLLDGAFSVALLHRDATYFESAGDAAACLIQGASTVNRS